MHDWSNVGLLLITHNMFIHDDEEDASCSVFGIQLTSC